MTEFELVAPLNMDEVPPELVSVVKEVKKVKSLDWSKIEGGQHEETLTCLDRILCTGSEDAPGFMNSRHYSTANKVKINSILFRCGLFEAIIQAWTKMRQTVVYEQREEKDKEVGCLKAVTQLCANIITASSMSTEIKSLTKEIFEKQERLYFLSLHLLKYQLDIQDTPTGKLLEEAAANAAHFLQVSTEVELLMLTQFLAQSIMVVIEVLCLSKSEAVKDALMLIMRSFDAQLLKANWDCFQKVREKAIAIFEREETREYGAACLNHIMITSKRLNFRKEHTELLVKSDFMAKQGNWFYRNFHQRSGAFSLEFIKNFVEIVWDGTNESCFNNELFVPGCEEIIDQHFAMLLKLSEKNDSNTLRVIRIGLSIIINCHMDFEEQTNASVRNSCGITVLNNLLMNNNINCEIHVAVIDLIIRVSQPYEIKNFKAPARSINFLMEHVEKCFDTQSLNDREATTPSGVRIPARNYLKTLTSLCNCKQNRNLIYTKGGIGMTQRVLRKPHHVDDVRCALSLLGHFLNFPEVIHTIDDTVYRFQTSEFYCQYGRDNGYIVDSMADLRDRLQTAKNKQREQAEKEEEEKKDAKLQIMFSVCGTLDKREWPVVKYLQDQGYPVHCFSTLAQEEPKILASRALLSAQYQVLLLFLRPGMEVNVHPCISNLADGSECLNHFLSYFSLTERKSFLLVSSEEDFMPQGWVEDFFCSTRIFNTFEPHFEQLVLEELEYLKKYEQNPDPEPDYSQGAKPWLPELYDIARESQDPFQDKKPEVATPYNQPVEQWTPELLKSWLDEKGIARCEKLCQLNGRQFLELARLRKSNYDIFWNEMRDDFKMPISDCLMLANLLDHYHG